MNSSLLLQNKTVLVPRGKNQSKHFSDIIIKNGGVPVEIPLIAFRPINENEMKRKIIKTITSFDWLIFTSQVTVDIFLSYFSDLQQLDHLKIAVIGQKTADSVKSKGLQIDFVPTHFVAEEFVMEFASVVDKEEKVLIPKGNLARNIISSHLLQPGIQVEEFILYETYLPEESQKKLEKMLIENKLDIITFTSSSTVDHFMRVVSENDIMSKLNNCIFAAIGPIAKNRAEEWGVSVQVVPEIYTVEEMIKSILDFMEK